MKKIVCLLLSAVIMICGAACYKGLRENAEDTDQSANKPEKLVVYINGTPSSFVTAEQELDLYPTSYVVGMRDILGEIDASGGNVFQQALEEYERMTGIQIEIHYLEQQVSSGHSVLQELYEKGQKMPDLVITSKHHTYDYDSLAKQGLLLDLTAYIENNESLQDADQYYQKVLDAGKIEEKQYVMPLLFNMNALITSESYLSEIGIQAPQMGDSYEDILYLLSRSCYMAQSSKTKEAIYEKSGERSNGQYIMSILNAAASSAYFDLNTNEVQLDEDTLTQIYSLMKEYMSQEYVNVAGWEDMTYRQLIQNAESKRNRLMGGLAKESYQNVGIFLTGGRGGGVNVYHNILMDAAYFNAAYANNEDTMVLLGIPSAQDRTAYTANVDAMAFSFASCEYPDAVYELMQYLMDYEYPIEMGLSVNCSITEKQLEEVQKTTLNIAPDVGGWNAVVTEMVTREDVLQSMEEISPLSENYVEIVRYMLEHMEGASLPCYILENLIFERVLREVVDETMTPREAAEWTIRQMQERIDTLDTAQLFYDPEYEFGLMGRSLEE